jgi:hypothetical protein
MSLKVAIANAKSFTDLNPLVEKVRCHLTFWGKRYITILNYKGTESIDALASRVIELANQYKFRFTYKERTHGKAIAERITKLYEFSDTQVEQSWFLTRVFVFFRNLQNVIPGLLSCPSRDCSRIRWYWKDVDVFNVRSSPTYSHVFEFYTRDQYYYFWHFGRIPTTSKFSHPDPERPGEVIDTWWIRPDDYEEQLV